MSRRTSRSSSYERRRHKSRSRERLRRSPSRSPSSSRSRRSSRKSRSSQSRRSSRKSRSSQSRRNSPTLRSRNKNGSHTSHNKNGMPIQTRVLTEQHLLQQEGIEIELKSLSLNAEDELSNRHKTGGIYHEVSANFRSIKKRLKHLSKNHETFSIDEAVEISDAAFLLKLSKKPEREIQLAGKMAHRGALLMLEADMLKEKGRELLDQAKHKLGMADL
ncbi:hypothetical protein RYX36_011852 [Vicia faba]